MNLIKIWFEFESKKKSFYQPSVNLKQLQRYNMIMSMLILIKFWIDQSMIDLSRLMKMVSHVVTDLAIPSIGQSFRKFDQQNQPTYNPQTRTTDSKVVLQNQRSPAVWIYPNSFKKHNHEFIFSLISVNLSFFIKTKMMCKCLPSKNSGINP